MSTRTNAMFKKFAAAILLAAFSALTFGADANPPKKMTYQGYVVDANGAPIANTSPRNYTAQFRIYNVSQGGASMWSEQQTVTIDKGYFSVILGEGSQINTELHGDLSLVYTGASASDRFVGLTVIIPGQTVVEIAPRLRLLSSPYAFLATRAQALVSDVGTSVLFANSGSVGIKTETPSSELEVNGKVTATFFKGNGAEISSINGANISSGTVADARLSSNIPKLNAAQSFTGANTFTAGTTFSGAVSMNAGATVSGTMTATTFSGNGTVPVGAIIMWSGSSVPAGWSICDGSFNGPGGGRTPDLRGRFILGASGQSPLTNRGIGVTGGEENHTLSWNEMPVHSHTLTPNTTGYTASYNGSSEVTSAPYNGKNNGSQTWGTSNAGGGAAHNTMPPFYTLAFIMRVQ